jgi:hypothetical protein
MTIRGMVIDIRSDSSLYVIIGDKTFYLDDSTGEAIMEWWPTVARDEETEPHSCQESHCAPICTWGDW